MPQGPLPLLPTTVIGSHAMPSWFWTATDEIDKGNYGQTDIRETFDDAVNMAMLDQERAGLDIISDGEMRRWYFVQSFYKRMTGIVSDPPLRKVGLYETNPATFVLLSSRSTTSKVRSLKSLAFMSSVKLVDSSPRKMRSLSLS